MQNFKKYELQVSYNMLCEDNAHSVRFTNSMELYNFLREIYDENRTNWIEEMWLICLNNQCKIIGYFKISQGGINFTMVDVRVVFGIALSCQASHIVISHNHPSGTIKPSTQDFAITKQIKLAGELMNIQLIDHIIYTPTKYCSLADDGLL